MKIKRTTKLFKKWFFQCLDPEMYVGEVKGPIYMSQDVCKWCNKDCHQKEELRRILNEEKGR